MKINPQPEPPGSWDIVGWIVYIFELIGWFFQSLFVVEVPLN